MLLGQHWEQRKEKPSSGGRYYINPTDGFLRTVASLFYIKMNKVCFTAAAFHQTSLMWIILVSKDCSVGLRGNAQKEGLWNSSKVSATNSYLSCSLLLTRSCSLKDNIFCLHLTIRYNMLESCLYLFKDIYICGGKIGWNKKINKKCLINQKFHNSQSHPCSNPLLKNQIMCDSVPI